MQPLTHLFRVPLPPRSPQIPPARLGLSSWHRAQKGGEPGKVLQASTPAFQSYKSGQGRTTTWECDLLVLFSNFTHGETEAQRAEECTQDPPLDLQILSCTYCVQGLVLRAEGTR